MSSVSNCTSDSDCQQGYSSAATHGIFTGKCNKQSGTCGIRAWCPIEQARLPRYVFTSVFFQYAFQKHLKNL